MDGVITDFFTGLARFNGKEKWDELFEIPLKVRKKKYDSIKGTDFFKTLPKFESTDILVDYLNTNFCDNWGILSSPFKTDTENSILNKTIWLEKYKILPSYIYFTTDKASYSNADSILVDDRLKNIEDWIKRGGIGILYNASTDDVTELIDKLNEYK